MRCEWRNVNGAAVFVDDRPNASTTEAGEDVKQKDVTTAMKSSILFIPGIIFMVAFVVLGLSVSLDYDKCLAK